METIIIDIGIACVLLLIGFWLRVRVPLLQKLYLPVSVIGGTIGMLLGPNVLGLVSPIYIPFSAESSGYATILLGVLLATMCLGFRLNRNTISGSINYFFASSIIVLIQVIIAFVIVRVMCAAGSTVNDVFAILPTSGFYGGHGFGAMVAAAVETIHYWDTNEIMSISTTFATIGLLYGVIGGVIIINIAARKGLLKYTVRVDKNVSKEDMTGYIEPTNRRLMIPEITKSAAIDPLALHFAFVFAIMAFAYGLVKFFALFPLTSKFNIIFCVTICGIIAAYLASSTKLKSVMDVDSMKHIGQTAMEVLIVISMANTNITVVASYGKEIIVCSVIILAITTVVVFGLCKYWFHKDNFEFGVFLFGVATGVLPTGVLLLKMADPEGKSDVLATIPAGATFTTIITQMYCMTVAPMVIVSAPIQMILSMTAITAVMLALGFIVARLSAAKTA